jgi:hypothetical protein
LEDAFQTGQYNIASSRVVIVDNPELDLALLFLDDGWLVGEIDWSGGNRRVGGTGGGLRFIS